MDYNLLNEIISLYSEIDNNFKEIRYFPNKNYNIDFNKINLKGLKFNLYIESKEINEQKIIPALKQSNEPSVVISIINEFNLVPLLNTLDVISEKNGSASIIIENQENSELALN